MGFWERLLEILGAIKPQIINQLADKIELKGGNYTLNLSYGNKIITEKVSQTEAEMILKNRDMDVAEMVDKFPQVAPKLEKQFDNNETKDWPWAIERVDDKTLKVVAKSAVAVMSTSGVVNIRGELAHKVTKDKKGSKRKS